LITLFTVRLISQTRVDILREGENYDIQ